jgi:hypothetical protein
LATKVIPTILLLLLCGLCSMTGAAQTVPRGPEKTWIFKIKNGTVTLTLRTSVSSKGQVYSLTIWPVVDRSGSDLAEEVGFLREVINQMSSLGMDPPARLHR